MYENFFFNAPAIGSWKDNEYFINNAPAAGVVKYGQDIDICVDPMEDDFIRTLGFMTNGVDYSGVGRIAFALAAEYGAEWIMDLRPINWLDMEDDHEDDLFLKDGTAVWGTVRDVPYFNADGDAIQLFDGEMRTVPRYEEPAEEDIRKCIIFADLDKLKHLFETVGAAVDYQRRRVPATKYPQFFSSYGNWQSTKTFPAMQRVLSRISREVAAENDLDADTPLLQSLGDNAYNNLSHRVRDQAPLLETGKGTLTKNAAGTYATTAKSKNTAAKAAASLRMGLPHEKYNRMMRAAITADKGDFRFETNVIMDVHKLKPENQNAEYVFERVMAPVGRGMCHGEVEEKLRSTFVTIHPDVGPRIYEIATFPITSLISTVYERVSKARRVGKQADPIDVELGSLLERLLFFGHTGSPKVLCAAGLKKLGPLDNLRMGLYPNIHEAFYNEDMLTVYDGSWPVDEKGELELPSAASQLYVYGEQHLNVSIDMLLLIPRRTG